MRGLIPAHIMTRIEQMTGLRMADMVDVFCGASTGSILNAALTLPHPVHRHRPRYRARHMVRFYEREGINIFPDDRFRSFRGLIHDFNNRTMKLGQLNTMFKQGHYDPSHLASALNRLFGDARLEDSLQSLVVPTYNIDGDQLFVVEESDKDLDSIALTKRNFIEQGGHAVWFKNIRFNKNLKSHRRTPEVKLADIVLASTAAPTYFPCHQFDVRKPDTKIIRRYSGIDGSVFDNPCMSFFGALHPHLLPEQQVIMIALGTGVSNKSVKKEEWNSYGSLGVVDPSNDLPLINILLHAPETALIETFGMEMEDRFYLFNKSLIRGKGEDPDLFPTPELDDASPENLKRMRNFAEIIMEENKDKLETVCDLLTKNHERRLRDPRHLMGALKEKIRSFSDD